MSRKRDRSELDEDDEQEAVLNSLAARDTKDIVQVLKKMLKRAEEMKEDNDLNKEVITEKDIATALMAIKNTVGDVIRNGEVTVIDESPDMCKFRMCVDYPLSIRAEELAQLANILHVCTVECDQKEINEQILTLKYTKDRKLSLYYKQLEDVVLADNIAPLRFKNRPESIGHSIFDQIESQVTIINDNADDLQLTTRSLEKEVTMCTFSVAVMGPVRQEKIAAIATHKMIRSVNIRASCNTNNLRIELVTLQAVPKKKKSSALT